MTENIGGFVTDMPYFIKIENEQIPIAGTWKYKIGAITKAQNPTTFFQYKPTGVYNGMIYPLRNYSIRGILWYQGESNTGYPYDYKDLLEAVIMDWRKLWNLGRYTILLCTTGQLLSLENGTGGKRMGPGKGGTKTNP